MVVSLSMLGGMGGRSAKVETLHASRRCTFAYALRALLLSRKIRKMRSSSTFTCRRFNIVVDDSVLVNSFVMRGVTFIDKRLLM